MRASVIICALAALLTGPAWPANAATENPASWDFALEASRELGGAWAPANWMSPSNVPLTFDQYDYTWQLTDAEFRIQVDGTVFWWPFDDLDESLHAGSIEDGLSFLLDPIAVGQDVPDVSTSILLGVLTSGFGVGQLSVISSDPAVTGVRVEGNFTVTAIPEPATVVLLSLGTLVLFRRRRTT
jgi:hypothetical protein